LIPQLDSASFLFKEKATMAKIRNPKSAPAFNENESPLYRLSCRKNAQGKSVISEFQFAAGERLRVDFERAGLAARITASWGDERTGGRSHAAISDNRIGALSESAIDARRRVHSAFDAVGPELSGVLYYICCLAGGLEQAERMLKLPQRSGKAVLSLALTRLARHYRLLKPHAPSAESSEFAHWSLADFRPQIMPQEPDVHQT
jgi:hypothetical protein